jgi:hypothetical protein
MATIGKIISGGQTGADRAALDFAIAHGIPHGGWCPHGRVAEDGPIKTRYRLTETPNPDPAQRTEWNVRDSDGTVIFTIAAALIGGSRRTAECARRYRRPLLHLSRQRDGTRAGQKLSAFLLKQRIEILNVAGPRQSGEPEVGRFVRELLDTVLSAPASGTLADRPKRKCADRNPRKLLEKSGRQKAHGPKKLKA